MSDRIIFLDFDGVLNTEHYQNYLYHEGKPWQDEHGAFFDPETVEQLRRIIDTTHAVIVNHHGSILDWKRCRICGKYATCQVE